MKDQFATTFHRDGTVTIWSVYQQRWIRHIEPEDISDTTLATLTGEERARIVRLIARRAGAKRA